MKIHDLNLEQIERVEIKSEDNVRELLATARRPIILTGLENDLSFLSDFNLDSLSQLNENVRTQRPNSDGVNYFFQYTNMPMSEFIERIRNGENLYAGARKVLDSGGVPTNFAGLLDMADKLKIPSWIERSRIYNACLWVGAGGNRTLLHYDAWDTVQMIGEGEKEYFVFPPEESERLHQHGIFDFKALIAGQVLHSKIRPLDVQERYQETFSKLKGFRGKYSAGEVMFVPAGFWHYVESSGLNIAVNFFIHFVDRSLQFKEPLRTYWIKANITSRPIDWYWALRGRAGTLYRRLFKPQRV
ncbi:cupin-like domain-containing protein [Thalassotalea fonticola]|uniref:Cupin-like domain-containing protein n=1 Tax=Thalassotalea fonticola TaxID=3065649 RepID=A0ABZ0GM55_9GAMM|nr:cupin-like domain-containing protein [Colwelliaceae bacterium S1-1]